MQSQHPRLQQFSKHHAHTVKKAAVASSTFIKKRKSFFGFWILRAIILIISIFILSLGITFFWIAVQPIPSIQSFEDRVIANSTRIYDRTGEVVLYDLGQNVSRQIVAADKVPDILKQAFIATEDRTFYTHKGIVPKSTIRAILFTGLNKIGIPMKVSGGSTITQQVVKNTLLTGDKSISRKLKEWFLAVKLDGKYTKDEILMMYLNEAPYGGSLYGVETGSQAFFGKSVSELDLAETAYLAAIPNAPSYLSPFGKHLDKLDERKNLILLNLLEQNYIKQEEYDVAKIEKVTFTEKKDSHAKALHFVEYVKQQLQSRYGDEFLDNQGLKVVSSLDWKLQQVAEESVAKHALENEKAWNASNQALVAIAPKTGEILSMVGSRGYEDSAIDGKFNVATAARQPGSSFKPFIYAAAFEKGYSDQTVVFDVPIQFSTTCPATNFSTTSNGSCYSPDNYDNKYVGPISLRNALGSSRNVPAVQMMYLVGTQDAIRLARSMGVSTLKNDGSYGLTLVLGGGEATLLDMTSSYGVFANEGKRVEPTAILKITDSTGKVLFNYTPTESQILDVDAARRVNSVLSDNAARSSLFGANSLLNIPGRPAAVKTGTTNNNKDAWMIGYNPNVVIGVWSGNNDNTPMKKGSIISGSTWREVMSTALSLYGYDSFVSPGGTSIKTKPVLRGKWWGNESVLIDKISGKKATEYTPSETLDEIITPNPHNILHWVSKGDPRGPVPLNPSSDSQYDRWEAGVQRWIANNPGSVPASKPIPTKNDDVHGPEFAPKVDIQKADLKKNGESGIYELSLEFSVRDEDLNQINIIVDGDTLETLPANTTTAQISLPPDATSGKTTLTISVEGVDMVFNKGAKEMSVAI